MLTDVVPSPLFFNQLFLGRGNSCVILMNGDRFIANSMNRALSLWSSSKSLLLFPGRYIMRDKCPSHCRYLWWWWWLMSILVLLVSFLSPRPAGVTDYLWMYDDHCGPCFMDWRCHPFGNAARRRFTVSFHSYHLAWVVLLVTIRRFLFLFIKGVGPLSLSLLCRPDRLMAVVLEYSPFLPLL